MTDLSEFRVLAESIGTMTVAEVGRESIKAIGVRVDPSDMTAHITLVPRDTSDAEQKRMIRGMFEVEKVFQDEITLTYVFADALVQTASNSRQLAYTA